MAAQAVGPVPVFTRPPQDEEELWWWLVAVWGVEIPRQAVCPGHCAPYTAVADAYFARDPISVWISSRGFGGKTTSLAYLGLTELVTLRADVRLLGGSGAQSQRIHEYMRAGWESPYAPRHLLASDPTKRETRLTTGARIEALMASQASVRGPHQQRLRIDEADEIELAILDASLGQPMSERGVQKQTVISSTHHNPDGTMTEVKRRAHERGWPVYQWCFRETLQPHGWLAPEEVESKRLEVTEAMWAAEYELQEPSPEGRAIVPERVEAMFDADRPVVDTAGQRVILEPPEAGARYAHGADWARKTDWTVFVVLRCDVKPMRVVAFQRARRLPWPKMVGDFDDLMDLYPIDAAGQSLFDATGVGDVVAGYLRRNAQGVLLVGRDRADLFTEYIAAIERGEIRSPRIEFMYGEHRYCRNEDLFGAGHPPDSFVAGALAYRASKETDVHLY